MEAVARLRNYPTSPRKMRLLADLVRGKDVEIALNTLKFSTKHPSVAMEKLLLSAIAKICFLFYFSVFDYAQTDTLLN